MNVLFSFFLLLCLLFSQASGNDNAQETVPLDAAHQSEGIIDSSHRYLSGALLYLPHTLDHFFADERTELELNASTFRLTLSSIIRKGGEVDFDQTLRAKLIMPHSKERLRFSFESTPADIQSNQLEQQNVLVENPAGEPQQSALLEAILKQTKSWRLSTDLGIKLHTPVDPFLRIRGSKAWHFAPWHVRYTQTLFNFKSSGAGARSVLDLEHTLDAKHLIRLSTSGTWWDALQTYQWSQYISLFKQLRDRRAIAYNATFNGDDRNGNRIDNIIFDIRLRQRLHREWIYVELSPAISHLRSSGFKANGSFTLRLELLFGNNR